MNDELEKSTKYKQKSLVNNIERLKKHNIFIIAGILFVLIPLIVSGLMEWSWMDFGTQKAESWMSFWGGYLGAFIGLVAVIYTTNKQIENSKSIMLDQAKEQTKQIKISADIHDDLERKRIYLNTILEKTLEFQKFTRGLESMYKQHSKKAIELLNEKKNIIDLLILREKQEKYMESRGDETAHEKEKKYLEDENQKIDEAFKKHQDLADQFRESKEIILGITNAIFTYKIFIELESKDSKAYLITINSVLDKLDEFILFSNDFVYFNFRLFNVEIIEISRIDKTINKFNDLKISLDALCGSLNRQSGTHIEAVLKQIKS